MAATKKGGRRYGAKAGEKVERALHEMKHGTLKSGRSGKKVTSRKQVPIPQSAAPRRRQVPIQASGTTGGTTPPAGSTAKR